MIEQTNIKKSPIIEVSNLAVFYNKKVGLFNAEKYWVLKDITFNVNRSETIGIIGRNGVGKTTLLRVLAGIIEPDKGVVLNNSNRTTLLALQLGFVPYLTGRENIILSALMLGMSRKEIIEKMNNIICFSEIDDFIDQPLYSYSAGMRARLGFSIAYYVDPDVLLIDEVLGVGDESFRIKSSSAMKEKIRSNKTVIIVSHNLHLLSEICNRLIWIENGILQAEGDVEYVLEEYRKQISVN